MSEYASHYKQGGMQTADKIWDEYSFSGVVPISVLMEVAK